MGSCVGDYCGTGSGNYPQPGDPDNNSILSAVSGFGGIGLSWTYPEINPQAVAHIILYRSTSGTEGTQVRHQIVTGDSYFDKVTSYSIEYFYWIQIVSVNGTTGDFIGPVSAIAKPPLEEYIQLLTGQISDSMLGQSLKEEIDKITLIGVATQQEVADRIDADAILGSALQDAQDQINGVGILLNNEVATRVDENSALYEAINQIAVSSGSAGGIFQEHLELKAEADAAYGTLNTTLQAAINNPDTGMVNSRAGLVEETEVQVDVVASIAANLMLLSAAYHDPDEGFPKTRAEILTKNTVDAQYDAAITESLRILTASTNNPDDGLPITNASMVDRATFKASEESAQAQTVSNMYSVVYDPDKGVAKNYALIKAEEFTRTQEGIATSQKFDTIEAVVLNNPKTNNQALADGQVTTFMVATEPNLVDDDLKEGDLWIDTDNANLLHRYDSDSDTWVSARDGTIQTALEKAEIAGGEVIAFWQNTAPLIASPGDIWFDTSDNDKPYRRVQLTFSPDAATYDWVNATGSAIAQAFEAVSTVDARVDGKVKTFYENNQPVAEGIGDLWVDTNNQNRLHRWSKTSTDPDPEVFGWVDIQDGKIADADGKAQSALDTKIVTFYSDTEPTGTTTGDLWINTTDGKNLLSRWDSTLDGGNGDWVNVQDADISVALGRNNIYFQNDAPTGNKHNLDDLWFDTNDNQLPYRWDGLAWEEVDLATTSKVAAQIQDSNIAMIGYCEINGTIDSSVGTPAACNAISGGVWKTAAPLAESIKTVAVDNGKGGTGTIEEAFTVYGNDIENILAEYTVKLDVDGYVAGFGITNDGATSQAIFNVETFSIGKLGSSTVAPFIVKTIDDIPTVVVDEALVDTLTFDKLRATDGSLIVENGKVKADYLEVNSAQSINYIPTQQGWLLDANGDAEFNSINVYDIKGNLSFATGGAYYRPLASNDYDLVVNSYFDDYFVYTGGSSDREVPTDFQFYTGSAIEEASNGYAPFNPELLDYYYKADTTEFVELPSKWLTFLDSTISSRSIYTKAIPIEGGRISLVSALAARIGTGSNSISIAAYEYDGDLPNDKYYVSATSSSESVLPTRVISLDSRILSGTTGDLAPVELAGNYTPTSTAKHVSIRFFANPALGIATQIYLSYIRVIGATRKVSNTFIGDATVDTLHIERNAVTITQVITSPASDDSVNPLSYRESGYVRPNETPITVACGVRSVFNNIRFSHGMDGEVITCIIDLYAILGGAGLTNNYVFVYLDNQPLEKVWLIDGQTLVSPICIKRFVVDLDSSTHVIRVDMVNTSSDKKVSWRDATLTVTGGKR